MRQLQERRVIEVDRLGKCMEKEEMHLNKAALQQNTATNHMDKASARLAGLLKENT